MEDGTIPSSGEPNIIYHGASSGLLTRGARPDRSHVARGFSKERARSDEWRKRAGTEHCLCKWFGHDPEGILG